MVVKIPADEIIFDRLTVRIEHVSKFFSEANDISCNNLPRPVLEADTNYEIAVQLK